MKSISIFSFFVVALFICLSVKYAVSSCYKCKTGPIQNITDSPCAGKLYETNTSMVDNCRLGQCSILKYNTAGDTSFTRTCHAHIRIPYTRHIGDGKWEGVVHRLGQVVTWTGCQRDLCNGDPVNPFTKIDHHYKDIPNLVVPSIECYDCTNSEGSAYSACREKFNSSMTKKCSASVCSIWKIDYLGFPYTIRSCGLYEPFKDFYNGKDHDEFYLSGTRYSWSICTTNLCNGEE